MSDHRNGLLSSSGDHILVWFLIIAFRLASVELGQFMNDTTLTGWHHFKRMDLTADLWLTNRKTNILFTLYDPVSPTEELREGQRAGQMDPGTKA